MGLRAVVGWRIAFRSCRQPLTRRTCNSHRSFASIANTAHSSTSFTAQVPRSLVQDETALLSSLGSLYEIKGLAAIGHNFHAIVLATSGLANHITRGNFQKRLAELMHPDGHSGEAHFLSAIVDNVPSMSRPPLGNSEGLSVFAFATPNSSTGQEPLATLANNRDDKSGALILDVGSGTSVTVPLANTIFSTGKPSTFMSSSYTLGDGSAQLSTSSFIDGEHDAKIVLPPSGVSATTPQQQPSLWLPLRPLTQPRKVTESFGNILRRVNIDGESIPASQELEASVDDIYKKLREKLPEGAEVPLVGVWAIVNPPTGSNGGSRRLLVDNLEDSDVKEKLNQAMQNGGGLYKLLSGGGGWGKKAGLLSLEPETSHVVPSEETDFESLFGEDSPYAPVGSEVQFFCSDVWSKEAQQMKSGGNNPPRMSFGVFEDAAGLHSETPSDEIALTANHFGAVSESGIYVDSEGSKEFKLSVPGAQISFP